MAQETRTQIKTYFQTGDVPTQTQFENLIESALWYDDKVVGGEVKQISIGNGSVGQVTIAANSLVEKIIIIGTASGTVNIGTSSGGNDLYDAEPFVNGSVVLSNLDLHYANSGTIYFSGHASNITVKVILRYV